MKTRQGFVSNSSSSSFILDKQDISSEMLSAIQSLPIADGVGRQTAGAVGKDAVRYAQEWNKEMEGYGEGLGGLGNWILEWAKTLGEDNIIFVRESDEGMGGYFSDVGLNNVQDFAKSEMEYH